jgi:hypothetical protein
MGEQVVRAFASNASGDDSNLIWDSSVALPVVGLARRILDEYGFAAYRLYTGFPDKKAANSVCRRKGLAAALEYMSQTRRLVNSPDRFIQIPIPVHELSEHRGPASSLRLSGYISPENINPVPGDLGSTVDSCFAIPTDPYMWCLHPDWRFKQIQERANQKQWHQAPERKLQIKVARRYFADVVLELEIALREIHPSLSAKALQGFWTSWELSEHLRLIEGKINKYRRQPGAVAASAGDLGDAICMIEEIIRLYVSECLRLANSKELLSAGAPSAIVEQVRKKRGRPQEISDDLKRKALETKGNRERAKVLYRKAYPTPQEVKNVPSILRHFNRTRNPPE